MLLSILMTSALNSILINCLLLFHLALFFLEISPVPLICGGMFLCLFILAASCVCFYVSGRSAMTPSHGGVALCSRCPAGLSGTVSLITGARYFMNIPRVGYVDPPVVIES